MKQIALLGSTGSIGANSLQVIEHCSEHFEPRYLTTFQNVSLLLEQCKRFRPKAVAVHNKEALHGREAEFRKIGVEVYGGFEGIIEISKRDDFDILINALVGAVGLRPTLNAIKKNRRIALANKESLVIGGSLVMNKARRCQAEVIPIDSEHSAMLQCLQGEIPGSVERLYLTASGGPFRELPYSEFPNITVEQALRHPNWNMGSKITIDSATMMNKGLEVIEACWLFDIPAEKIQVLVHPQSIIHSMVEFQDGSLKAQLGLPDMRVPIQYALTYPKRLPASFAPLDFSRINSLTFEAADFEKFRCLELSFRALQDGGGAPTVLNAANEEAVDLFLNRKIRFDQIAQIVEGALTCCEYNSFEKVEELLEYDAAARDYVLKEHN